MKNNDFLEDVSSGHGLEKKKNLRDPKEMAKVFIEGECVVLKT